MLRRRRQRSSGNSPQRGSEQISGREQAPSRMDSFNCASTTHGPIGARQFGKGAEIAVKLYLQAVTKVKQGLAWWHRKGPDCAEVIVRLRGGHELFRGAVFELRDRVRRQKHR